MMRIHVDAESDESHALLLKAHPLFESMLSAEENLAS